MPAPKITITETVNTLESSYPIEFWVISTAPFEGVYTVNANTDLTTLIGVNPSKIADWFGIAPNSQLKVVVTSDLALSSVIDNSPSVLLLDDTVVTALAAEVGGFYVALDTVALANTSKLFVAVSQSVDIATAITDVATLADNIGIYWGVNPVLVYAHAPYYGLEIQEPLAGFTYPLLSSVTTTVASNSELDTLYDANLNGVKNNTELGNAVWGAKLLSGLNMNTQLIVETIKYQLTNLLLPFLLQPITSESEPKAAIDSYLSQAWLDGWLQGSYNTAFSATVTLLDDPQTLQVNLTIKPVSVLESINITLSIA